MEERCFQVGDKAPDYILMDHNKKEFKLSKFKDKRVLLSFHPLAWTSICAQQMQTLERNQNNFNELNTVAVGISVDSIPCKNAWANFLKIKNTRLLSDFWPHGEIAKLYKVFRKKDGFSERANIIINEKQKIDFVRIYEISELPDIREILTFLRGDE